MTPETPPRDLLLHNARIRSGAETNADTAIVRDGRFVFVGRAQDATLPTDLPTFDARGRRVLPGFTDSHAHLLGTGAAMRAVNLKGVGSANAAAARVAERVAGTADGEWVRGAGWDQHLWPDARFPTRAVLDAIAPSHPVVLTHTSGHCIWVNSAALRIAGVTSSTTSPSGGAIDIDEAGQPTGILRDTAARLVQDIAPPPSREDRLAMLSEAIAHAQSLGVTGVHAMDVGRGEWAAVQTLHHDRRMQLRVRAFLSATRLDDWIDAGARTGDGDEMLRVGGIKFFADGALGSMTAWMREPYAGTSDCGLALQPADELEQRVRRCFEHGLAPAIHAIGDRANHEVLDILERARDLAPQLPRRIEHAQLLDPHDVPRFAQLGVAASVQPIHATQDMEKVDRAWGERGRYAYAFASLLKSGARLAFGSDTPVETMDPLVGVHAAVRRQNAAGEPTHGWYPQERISVDAALAAYTTGAAQAVGEAERYGEIATGYAGDFVVLSDDPFGDVSRLLQTTIDATVVAGAVVFERR